MNLLKNYSKVSRLSYGSIRSCTLHNKLAESPLNSKPNNLTSRRSESFASHNKGPEHFTSTNPQSNSFNTAGPASGFGSSNAQNHSNQQNEFIDTATSVAQNVVNTAANFANTTVQTVANTAQGMANAVFSGIQNSNNQGNAYHSDPNRDQYYKRGQHPEQFTSTDTRYNQFNRSNTGSGSQNPVEELKSTIIGQVSSGVTGAIAKGIFDTASSIASNLVPGGQRSQSGDGYQRNDNIISSTIKGISDAAQGFTHVASTLASDYISGNQTFNRRPSSPSENRSRDSNYQDKGKDFMYTGSQVRNMEFSEIEKSAESDTKNFIDTTKQYVNTAGAAAQEFVGATASGVRDLASKTSEAAGSAVNNFVTSAGSATLSAMSSAARKINEAASSTDRPTDSEQRFVYSGTQVNESLNFVATENQGLYGTGRGQIPLYDIVISGGGVAGGALACALAHCKHFSKEDKKIILLDPSEPPSLSKFQDKNVIPDQRVVSLSLSSVNFLKELGVWSLLNRDRIGVIKQMQVWEIGGNSFIKFNDNPSNEIGYVVETIHLQAALFERLRQLENVKVDVPNKITDLRNEPGSFSTVILNDEEKISARLVVGSDGTNSIVKRKSNIGSSGWSCLQQGIVCTVKTPYHNTTAWQRFLSTGPLAVLPLWDEYSSIVWSCENSLHSSLQHYSDEDFLRELNYQLNRRPLYETPNLVLNSNATFDLPPVITEICNKRRSFPLNMSQANQFVAHRVALIGDAAHNVHPLAGQGLNLGLTDAAYLANTIVKNLRTGNDIGSQDLLKEYEVASMNLNSTMMYSLEFIKRMYENNENSPSVFMRNIATATINNVTPIKSLFIDAANGKYSQPVDYEWKRN